MNKVHRIVWSDTRQAWVVTHENAGTRGKPSSTRRTALAAALAAFLGSLGGLGATAALADPAASALPTGGQVVSGSATLGTKGPRLDIVQSTARAAIDWQSFNIGAQAQVHFDQPAGGATLNRVLGTDASQIFGKLTSTGQVFLVNPNGMLFAPGAQVNVGGLVASTRNISNSDFMAGRLTFEGSGGGAIINQANVTTTAGGTVALIAAKIVNSGSITAPQGQVLMGAGDKVTLDLGGPVKIEVTQGAIEALIDQGGAIRADGGLVYLTARAAGTLATAAINQSGSIEANTLTSGEKGEILLIGDMARGTLKLGGSLKAEGGFIETSAAQVQVQPGAQVQAGHWLLDPTDITVDAALAGTLQSQLATGTATVQTLATGTGNGDIFVNAPITWSSGKTLTLQAHRNIEINAQLDASGGSGGKLALQYGLGAVAAGNTATYTINAPALLKNSGLRNGNNGSTATNFSTKLGSNGTTANYTVLSTAAALQAIEHGLIGSYALGADINLQGVSWTPIGRDSDPFFGRLDGLGHTISKLKLTGTNYLGLFGFTAGATLANVQLKDFLITSTIGTADSAYAAALVGTAYNTSIRNVGIDNITIDASAGSNSNGSGSNYLGGLVGEMSGGTIAAASARNISLSGRSAMGGIVGSLSGDGSIRAAQVDGLKVRITGFDAGNPNAVGGIAGSIAQSTAVLSITQSSARGLDIATVTGAFSSGGIGGLVGNNFQGHISDSYAEGSIVANNYTGEVGGFSAMGGVGGLVGIADSANISNAYSLVDVKLTGSQGTSGFQGLGGLVGVAKSSTITNAYATGKVEHTLTGTDANYVGGFLGAATGTTVNGGYWDTQSSGVTKAVGSASATTGSVSGSQPKGLGSSTAFSAGSYTGFDFTNTWFMAGGETRPFLRSEWSPTIRNAHQLQLMTLDLKASYTLANDIDLGSPLGKRSEMWKCVTSTCATFQGNFVPVGDQNKTFAGSFNGQGHTVSKLHINRPATSAVGLFGATFNASIQDIGLLGGSVTGSNSVGGLVGQMISGSITRAYNTGQVAGSSAGGGSIGGLVGYAFGELKQVYSTGSVTGSSGVGGLAGLALGSIQNAYSTGSVQGDSSVGGLVGNNFSNISDAYATGSVTGQGNAGGLVGSSNDGGSVTRAFSTGAVTASYSAGGLIGIDNTGGGNITDSFWDTETSGQASSAGGTGKSTAEMKHRSTFAGWGEHVVVEATLSDVYPQLRFTRSGLAAGTSAWVIGVPITLPLHYNLGAASGSYIYQGSDYSLASIWSPASIFGSGYSSWVAGTDYSFTYSGNTVTGFSNAGSYTGIGVSILKSGFVLASSGNTEGSLSITPKTLTGSISGGGSVYGQALNPGTLALSGVIGSDAVSAGAVTVNTTGMTLSASLNWNADTYARAQSVGSALSGAKAGNYRFAGATANYTVTPATITSVSGISAIGRVYDGSNSATLDPSRASFNGLLSGDNLIVTRAFGVFTNPNAGNNKQVFISGITLGGPSASNYSLANGSAQGLGFITQKTVLVSNITASNKVYDGSSSATLNTGSAVFQGLIGGDQLNLATATGAFADKNAGSGKQVDISGMTLGGAAAGNYRLGNASELAYATITPKALTVSGLSAVDKTYDGSASAKFNTGGATLTGLVGGDTPTVDTVSGSFADANAGVGKAVTVSAITLAGAGAGNYTPTSAATTATINKATLLVSANDFVASGSSTPSIVGQSGCVLVNSCVGSIGLSGSSLSLNFATGQLASNYDTTLQVGNAAGSLSVNRALSWSGFNLGLSAAADIHINSALTAGGAGDKLSLVYGQSAVAAANPYTYRFGLTDAGFSGKAELQAGQNFSTRQGSDGTAINYTVLTALGTSASSNDGTLQGMQGSLAGNFVLGTNIDASATSGWNSGTGWTAIGNGTTQFSGRFDGLGHTVSNLTIAKSDDVANNYQGLFGYANGASLAHVGVENASITGARFLAALLGQGDDTDINQSYARNAVVTGERGVAGLAGFLRLGSNVNDSFASGETRGNGVADISYFGGLVGLVEGFNAGSGNVAANIRRSFANVTVASAAGSDRARVAGGLVGQFRGAGVIEDSFALGEVRGRSATGGNGVGGLVGLLGRGDAVAPTLTRSHASGAVSTDTGTSLGGLVGVVDNGSVSNSFWDTQTTGRGSSAGGSGAVGKTSEQMQRLDTFTDAGWNLAYTDAANYAGISDFRRAGLVLDGSGQWRMNPRYIPYALSTIGAGNYSYNGTAQLPVDWSSDKILGAAFAGWVLGTDYVLTQGGNNLTSFTDAGNYSNVSITFLRGGAGHYQNASSGNTLGNFTLDKAKLVVRAVDDARFVTQSDNAGYQGVTYSGFVANESNAALGGTLSVTRSDNSNNAAGSYTLTPSGLSSGNYAFDYQNGAYQIVAADKLLVKAGTVMAGYGQAISYSAPTVQYVAGGNVLTLDLSSQSGASFVFAENGAPSSTVGFTLQISGASNSSSGWLNAGGYNLGGSAFTANTPNYTGGAGNVVYSGYLKVAPKAVTVSFDASKTYDRTTALSAAVSATGVVNGDNFALAGSGQFSTNQAGSQLGYTLTLAPSGSDAANYVVSGANPSGGNYIVTGHDGRIDKKALSLSGLTANHKVYNGSALASFSGTAALTGGVVSGDSLGLSGSALGLFADRNVGTALAVSLAGLSLSGDGASNYSLTLPSGYTANITPASISAITGITAAGKVYDGSSTAVLDTGLAGFSGIVFGDNLTVASAIGSFNSRDAGTGKTVNISGLSLGGTHAGNYTLASTTASTTATINRATLSAVTGLSAANKTYDGSSAATLNSASAGFTGMISGDDLSVYSATTLFADQNAGSGKTVNISGITLGGTHAANYLLADSSASTTADIAAKQLTISGSTAANKTYDGSNAASISAGTLTGLVGSETLTISASGSFANQNAGVAKAVTASYSLADGGNGGLAGNYSLAGDNLTADIAQASATVTAHGGNGVYNGLLQSVGGYTVSGLVNGESAGVLSGISASGASASNAGTYTNTVSGNANNGNYLLSFVNGTLTIAKAEATVTANSGSGTYNGLQQSVSGYSVSGLVNGESAGVLTGVTASVSGTNAGSYISVASGSDGNYNLSFINGELQISRANATVTANSGGGVYTGQTQSVSGFSVSGLVNGESAGVLSGISASGASASNAGSSSNSISGAAANGNYLLSFVDGALRISQAEATVTANSHTGSYTGQAQSVVGYSVSGLVNGESAGVLSGISTSGASGTDAGFYLNAALGDANNGNYRLSFNNGALIINKVDVTVTANSGSGTYNGLQQSVSGYTVSGLVNGESASVLDQVSAGGSAVNAGVTTLIASGHDNNYTLNFVNGTLDIAKAKATVTANSGRSTYNGQQQSVSGSTVSGLVNGETAGVLSGIDAEGSGTRAGSYTSSVSGPTDNGNYTLSFVNGSFVIDKASVSVTGIAAANKTYDGRSGATLNTAGAGFSGLFAGDTLTVASATGSFADKNVGSGKPVSISGITLGGTSAGDYTLASSTASASADITRLASVAWVGGSSGNWFDPANWAGGAVPDLGNVAQVVIPANVTVSFNSAGAVAPAMAGQPVSVDSISGASAGLNLVDGQLDVANSLQLATYAQSGGTANVGGEFGVAQAFQQSGGQINAGGPVSITQSTGSALLGNLKAGSSLTVRAQGDIAQASGSALTVAGATTLASSAGDVTLANAGNRFTGAVNAAGRNIGLAGSGPLTLGTIAAGGSLGVRAEGSISQAGDTAVSVAGETTLASASADVTLTQAANRFTGAVNATGRDIGLAGSGDMLLGTIAARGNLVVSAQDDITQASGSALTVGGFTTLATARSTVLLSSAGNSFANPPTIIQPGGIAQASAIANAQQSASNAGSGGSAGSVDMAEMANLALTGQPVDDGAAAGSGGAPSQSGGLLLVETTGAEATAGRDPAGFLRMFVVDGGIKLPQGAKPAAQRGAAKSF